MNGIEERVEEKRTSGSMIITDKITNGDILEITLYSGAKYHHGIIRMLFSNEPGWNIVYGKMGGYGEGNKIIGYFKGFEGESGYKTDKRKLIMSSFNECLMHEPYNLMKFYVHKDAIHSYRNLTNKAAESRQQ